MKPSAKVIDFGIAKATGHQLTEKTLLPALRWSHHVHIAEQAGRAGHRHPQRHLLLGCAARELLTGSTPFSKRAQAGGYDGSPHHPRERAPKPSTRLNIRRTRCRQSRRTSHGPAKLTRLVAELDWIVMKARRKTQWRYETANGYDGR